MAPRGPQPDRPGGSTDTGADRGATPTFLIIGAQKCATVWLGSNLGAHPDVFVAGSEVTFFNNDHNFVERGLPWYRDQFAERRGEPIVGESTPGYLMMLHRPELVAERIHTTLPDVRLLAILRNPVDRAQSALAHHIRRRRLPPGTRLVDYVRDHPPTAEPFGLLIGGLYAQSLAPYHDRFGERLLVLLLDDVAADPGPPYARALAHIGASAGFAPADLAAVRHSNQGDTGLLARGARPGTDMPGRARERLSRVARTVGRRPHRPGDVGAAPLTDDDRRTIHEFFAADLADLSRVLGRDLSRWDPPP